MEIQTFAGRLSMSNREFVPIPTNKEEERLFFHSIEFPSKKDKLVLFLSYMRHWVEPNNTAKECWGMSFNVIARDRYEPERSLQSVVI